MMRKVRVQTGAKLRQASLTGANDAISRRRGHTVSVILLTLVLSISMLAPELSFIPAAYAQDETPALTQTAEGADTAAPAAEETAGQAAGDSGAAATDVESGTADAVAPSTDAATGPAAPAAGQEEADPAAGGPSANAAAGLEATGPAAAPNADAAEQFAAVPAADALSDMTSYDRFYMTDLYDAGAIKIPEEMQDKIQISHTEYGNGLLFTGTVGDLNSTYITLGYDFNFDKGSIGRLSFDGLKDKDRGMTVEVQVYLDDSKTPVSTFSLKKQMGKKEWTNTGEKSVDMGTSEITGKHKVSLLLKIGGKKDSAKTSVMLKSMQFCVTTLPVMYVNIDESEGTIEAMNASTDHSVECYGDVDLVVPDAFNADETFRDEYGVQESRYGMELEYIRGRGNSTWYDDKKPYKLKFDKSQDLFGLGKNKHWILLANRYDNSLVRNRMTYWLGQQLGMAYTPQCVPVEFVLNGEYYGSYLLCEQIRVGTGRVTIDDLDEENIPVTDPLIETGGYLLSLDYEQDEKRSFLTEHGMNFFIESPDDNVAYFNEYIKAFTQKVENAIFSEDFTDGAGHKYTEYLDLDAAADYWWVQEFSANGDAYGSGSTYLYKKRDSDENTAGKIYWGPLWDFDYVAWGDLYYDADPPESLDVTHCVWFHAMKGDAEFVKKLKERWYEKGGVRDTLLEITKEGGLLDKYIVQMETSYRYDHEKWGAFESKLTEYEGEIEQLREWINKRIEFVDIAVEEELSLEPHNITFRIDGKVVKEAVVTGALREKDFPEVPEKKGYKFWGWKDDDYEDYDPGRIVTKDVVLNAIYVEEGELLTPEKIFFRDYDVYYPLYESGSESGYYDTFYQPYSVMPQSSVIDEIVWTSSDESVVSVEEYGELLIRGYGDVTITATINNGVTGSYDLHIVRDEDLNYAEEVSLSTESLTMKTGEYSQVLVEASPKPCQVPEIMWISTDENIATVDSIGVVTAVSPGKADLFAINIESNEVKKVSVTVKPDSNKGRIVKRSGSTYKITSDKKGSRTAMLVKAKNASKVVIPAYIKLDGKKYSVNRIKAKAFAKSKATRLTIKTKKLTKARVKGALKGSKVKKIFVRVGKKKANRTYIKKYKKIFTKKNAGKGVVVSAS